MNPNMPIYFDNASTTQPYQEVLEGVTRILEETYGNPSSTHGLGRTAKSLIENTRKVIAKELRAQASEIVFTSGGTEANNLILRSSVRDLGVNCIITSKIEHHSVLHTVEQLQAEYATEVIYVNILENGNVDLLHLELILKKNLHKKKLVSLMHVNNEIGNILPLTMVASLCQSHSAYFHSDAVQSIGHFPLDVSQIPIDFITASAHKFHGVKGVGFAYIRKGIPLKSLILGGEQERGMRGGTENVLGIASMGLAFSLSYTNMDKNATYIKELKAYFIKTIKEKIPEVLFNGNSESLEESSYAIVNISLPLRYGKGEVLLFNLDLNHIACSRGSACQSGSSKLSHVLETFLPPERLVKASLRLSFSLFNTRQEIDRFIEILLQINTRSLD